MNNGKGRWSKSIGLSISDTCVKVEEQSKEFKARSS